MPRTAPKKKVVTKKTVTKMPVAPTVAVAGRVRGARADATLEKMQRTIETQFKLPRGSVLLVGPGNRRMPPDSFVADLRSKWDRRS